MGKKYVKNVTDDNKTIVPELGRPYSPATLAYKENGVRIVLKPGEMRETKLTEKHISGKRLKIVEEGSKPKVKEEK